MADLRSRLREADRVLPPDLWPEIGARAERIGEPSPERSPSGVRKLLVAALAFGVFAASGVLAWEALRPGPRPPAPSGDPWGAYGEGWSELPAPPEVRQGATMAWAGDELVYWGGVRAGDKEYAPTSDGYAFDPVSGTWRSIPPSPAPGKFTRAVWTGSEVIFWGAGRGQDSGLASGIGLAFDRSTERWRELPPSPHQPSYGGVLVWTGSELIWWGGGQPGDPENSQGAAYDPESNTWRTIADAPIGVNQASGVWTGKEMIVFGSLLNRRNIATTQHAVGAAYDPATDTWREIAPSELSPQASSAVWVGDRMVAWDYGFKAAEYFPDRDEWRPLPDVPGESGECYVDSAVVQSMVFAWDCGYAAILPPGGAQWEPVNGGVTEPTVTANDRQYRLFRFAQLVPAGEVLAMAAEGITVGNKGMPCYGCPGAPTSFWVYRPPILDGASSPTPVRSDVALPAGLSATRVAIGDGAVWVLASPPKAWPSTLLRIDPATDRVIANTALEGRPWYVAVGGGSVWVGSPQSSTLQRVDASSNEVTTEINLPGDDVTALAGDDQAIWAEVIQDRSDEGRPNLASLARIDPETDRIVATIPLDGLTGYDDEIAIGVGAVWVAGVNPTGPSEERGADLVRIDPETNSVAAILPVQAFSVQAGADAVWVTAPADGVNDSLHKPEAWVARRIDPATDEVSSPIPVPGNLGGVLAVTDEGVWFSGYDDQGRIHPLLYTGNVVEDPVPPIDALYTDMVYDPVAKPIWIASIDGLIRVDLR